MISQEIQQLLIDACNDAQGVEPLSYFMDNDSSIVDYYIACTANSLPHLKSLKQKIEDTAKKNKLSLIGSDISNHWIVLDYADVIIHLFLNETRKYYNIEEIWKNNFSNQQAWECKDSEVLQDELNIQPSNFHYHFKPPAL